MEPPQLWWLDGVAGHGDERDGGVMMVGLMLVWYWWRMRWDVDCGCNIVGEREPGIDCGWNDGKTDVGGDRNDSGRDNCGYDVAGSGNDVHFVKVGIVLVMVMMMVKLLVVITWTVMGKSLWEWKI